MNQIKCPSCGEVFTVSEDRYAKLLQQVKDSEFNMELDRRIEEAQRLAEVKRQADEAKAAESESALKSRIAELENKLEAVLEKAALEKEIAVKAEHDMANEENAQLKMEISALKEKSKNDLAAAASEKEIALQQAKAEAAEQSIVVKEELAAVKAQLATAKTQADSDLKLALANAKNESDEAVRSVERERDELASKINTMVEESRALASAHKIALAEKDEEIERVKTSKSKLSTKMLGETLEQHCEMAFNQVRSYAFPRAEFGKDNDSSSGTKGDFIYRELDDNGTEVLSIMFEMKNESEDSKFTKKNSDHFKKLDKDRTEKKCEYAVLVSLLEPDSDLYNGGIVDVSYQYPKMFVIRPQFFIPFIGLLRNAALDSLKYKQDVQLMRQQNIDVTNFEDKLESFKKGFANNFNLASTQFNKAVEEIDKAIDHLQKTREQLLKSERNLDLANKKLDGITVRKLTYKNQTMKEAFKKAAEDAELLEVEVIEEG